MIKVLINAYRKHSTYRSTYKELSRLSNHELQDLGLHRSMLEDVARDAAYGKEKSSKFAFFNIIFKTEKDKIEEYLADSVNTVDLENRLKNIDRGLAPWQIQARHFAQGWSSQ